MTTTSYTDRAAMPGGREAFAVPARAAADIRDVLREYTSWIELPETPAAAPTRLSEQLRESREATGWSLRDLADVLGTTHTTVRRLEIMGTASARSRETAARAAQLHGVLVRLARIAPDAPTLATALATYADGTTAREHLRSGDWSRAFTAALDVIRGPRPAMLGVVPGGRPGAATREIRP